MTDYPKEDTPKYSHEHPDIKDDPSNSYYTLNSDGTKGSAPRPMSTDGRQMLEDRKNYGKN